MSCCVGTISSDSKLLAGQTSFSGKGDKILRRRGAAAYMTGYLKTVAHAVLSPYGLYLSLYMYGCGCTYWVTLSVQLGNAATTCAMLDTNNIVICTLASKDTYLGFKRKHIILKLLYNIDINDNNIDVSVLSCLFQEINILGSSKSSGRCPRS